jgi:hypothetical protein
VGLLALLIFAGGVWQAYRTGYNAGKRETLFRFMTLADKDVTRSLATTPQEERFEDSFVAIFKSTFSVSCFK